MVVARLMLLIVVIGGCAAGCGQRLPLVPVTGHVTVKGEPLSGAIVVFAPEAPVDGVVRISSAVTDADGRFKLQTNYSPRASGKGALAGSFKVTVSKSVPGKSLPQAEFEKHLAEYRRRMKDQALLVPQEHPEDFLVQVVPQRYTSVATTPLTAEVANERANNFTFTLE